MATQQVDRILGLTGDYGVKTPCRVATTTAVTLSGLQTVDTVALVDGDRVLVKNQADTTQNGIYLAHSDAWERAFDFDGPRDCVPATALYVRAGTQLGFWGVVCADALPIIGVSLITFIPVLVGNSATTFAVTPQQFGAPVNGSTNDSSSTQTALNQGLPVWFGAGTYKEANIVHNFASQAPLNIYGAGILAATLSKFGSDANPIITVSSPNTILDVYSEISNLAVIGDHTGTHDGVVWNNISSSNTRNLYCKDNAVGLEAQGVLISQHWNLQLIRNTIGYRARKSADNIYCNRMAFYGGQWKGNTQWAVDYGDGQGVLFQGVDIEQNGTTGVPTTTGGMIIRGTVDDETGVGQVVVRDGWFEANLGTSLIVENGSGVFFKLSDSVIYSPENHHAATIGAVNQVYLDNVVVAGPSDEITIGISGSTLVIGGFVAAFTDLSTIKTYINAHLGGTFYPFFCNGAGVLGAISSDRNAVTAADSAATTLGVAKAGGTRVDVWITGAGTQYCGDANIVCDGTNAAVRGSSFGANVTITVSGLNIQVTQTSGVSQAVQYSIQRFGNAP